MFWFALLGRQSLVYYYYLACVVVKAALCRMTFAAAGMFNERGPYIVE